MGDTESKPYAWTVNFIGKEGFREYIRVESSDPADLVARRAGTMKQLIDDGAVSDVRKLFDDNGTKPGKLAQSAPQTEGVGVPLTSKLARFAKAEPKEEKPTSQEPDEALAAMRASGFLTSDQADKVEKSLETPPGAHGDNVAKAPTTASASKLAKFKQKPAAEPAPAPTQEGPASEPNVSPKLARFVKTEKKAE